MKGNPIYSQFVVALAPKKEVDFSKMALALCATALGATLAHAFWECRKLRAERRLRERRTGSLVDWNAAPAPGTRKTFEVAGVEYAFRYCPSGTFAIGSAATERGRDVDEKRLTVVLTNGFWLLETPVTVAMFRSFIEATRRAPGPGYKGRGGYGYDPETGAFYYDARFTWERPGFEQTEEHPATCVDWASAVAFCEWLAKETALPIRLPTETEWERACRAGTTTAYSFGDDPSALTRLANVADASAGRFFSHWATTDGDDGFVFTSPVRSFDANRWGLYDMHGNVWEWCSDWYAAERDACETVDPKGPATGTNRTMRGGSWSCVAKLCRSANRAGNAPTCRGCEWGFRVAIGTTDGATKEERSR